MIRQANIKDAAEIMECFKAVVAKMQSMGLYNWSEAYPSLEKVTADIENESLFVTLEDGRIVGMMTLDEKQDRQYVHLKWASEGKRILVVHRLAIHPDCQGKGMGKRLMNFAENFALHNKYEAIRLDVYKESPARFLYQSMDYQEVGTVYFVPKGQKDMDEFPFLCYEKIV